MANGFKQSVPEIDEAFKKMEARLKKQGCELYFASASAQEMDRDSNMNVAILGQYLLKHCDGNATAENFVRAAYALKDELTWTIKPKPVRVVRDSLGDVDNDSVAAADARAAYDSGLASAIESVLTQARQVSEDFTVFRSRYGPANDYTKTEAKADELKAEFARLMAPYAKRQPTLAQAQQVLRDITELHEAQQISDPREDQV